MAWQIRSTSVVALGNGTRQRGFLFGCIETDEKYHAAMEAVAAGRYDEVLPLVQAEEGVAPREIINALRTQFFGGPVQVDDVESESHEDHSAPTEEELTSISLEELGLSKGIEERLRSLELTDAMKIVEFSEHNGSLTVIEGIGEAADEKKSERNQGGAGEVSSRNCRSRTTGTCPET